MGCIYKYTNNINQKSYIGYTKRDAEARKKEHLRGNGNQLLKHAVKKDGEHAFTFDILEDGIIPELLPEREKYWIAKFDTFHNGYNLTTGGEGGFEVSPETRQKMSISSKGKPKTEEHCRSISIGQKGKPKAESTKRKISKARKGKNYGVIGKNHPKYGKPAYNRRPEYTQAYELFLSLPPEMSVVEKRHFLQNHFTNIKNADISRWIQRWTGSSGRNPTHRDYERAHKFFLSLPLDMSLSEKRRLLRENFPNIGISSQYRWIKKWTGKAMAVGRPSYHPERSAVYDYFLSLPPDMDLREKNETLYNKFPKTQQRTIRYWTRQWDPHKTSAGLNEAMRKRYFSLSASLTLREKREIIYKEYSDCLHRGTIARKMRQWESEATHAISPKEKVHKFFLSLPSNMPLPNKRVLLHNEFPNVSRKLLNRWLNKWSGTKTLIRHPDKVPARGFFLSLPADMVLSEKRILLREKFPNVKRGTLNKWTRQWQSDGLAPTL